MILQKTKMATDASDKYDTVLRTLKERIEKKLPPATPDIVSSIAALIGVERKSEYALMRSIKATLESYVQKQYALTNLLEDLEQPIASLRDIRRNQVKEDIVRKPLAIIMCQECEKRSSVLKCEQCQDHFCQECFDVLHATGNRKSHLIQEVEQLVCVACDATVADCQCVQCGSFFCSPCFVSIHSSRSDLHRHRKRTISGLVCQECEHAHAAVLCEDCMDLFCSPCYLRLHKNGQRKQHTHLTVDANGQVFRGGLLIPPTEAQVLIERSRSTTASGPWIHYRDDTGESYWHNCHTDEESHSAPPL